MSAKIPKWIVVSDGGVRCQRCGKFEPMPLPMPVDGFMPWCEYIGAVHLLCKDTGRVDAPAQSVGEWFHGRDTGISSMAIYRHMMGLPRNPRDSRFGDWPLDPDDFGRCYRLLVIAPEWRARIGEMARHGKEWAALAGAWDELTAMYEDVIARKAKLAPELYHRMQALIATPTPSEGGKR